VPCYNEASNAEETLQTAAAVDYPEFEVIAINDGSRDNTGELLDQLIARIPKLRVVHLAANRGKATALNTGALLAKHELLVCIDGDALLDPHALRWIARAFLRADVGAIGGSPRIRNRTSLLGRLQVGEFASIIGLIRRAQTMYGRLFTVSGVICAFRKRALDSAGWWSTRTATEDIDVTWRLQLAGWRVIFEPNAIVWILMPETLHGLWRQRLRWAEGGTEMMLTFFRPLVTGRTPSLLPTYFNYLASLVWSYAVVFALGLGLLWAFGLGPSRPLPQFRIVPTWWGVTLTLTYLPQALISVLLEGRYERGMARSLFWMIWYPAAFWVLSAATTIVALPRVLLRPRKDHVTWVSPDRGLR
jgi:biofilm PGA synthesis N-glycosyltransferase PgaC